MNSVWISELISELQKVFSSIKMQERKFHVPHQYSSRSFYEFEIGALRRFIEKEIEK